MWQLSWKLEDSGEITVKASVPEGCEAEVELPSKQKNARFTVQGGSYTWQYRPERDYLHPYSLQSLVTDLLAEEKTAAVIKEALPDLYERCSSEENEELVRSLNDCVSSWSEDKKQQLDTLLKQIKL